jgi:hypothetical protein
MALNGGYNVYSDNAGAGADNTRMWIDGPNDGEFLVGPRGGADNFFQIRLRHDKISAVSGVVLRQDSAGVLYLTSSSRRYKTLISPLQIDLDALRKIEVVHFKERPTIADLAVGYARERAFATGRVNHDGEPERLDPTEAEIARATEAAPWCLGVIAEEIDELGLTDFVCYSPDENGAMRPESFRYELAGLGALQLVASLEERVKRLEERLAKAEGEG